MYSRYTPNESGGYDRRALPDAADLRAAQGRPPPEAPQEPREAESALESPGEARGPLASGPRGEPQRFRPPGTTPPGGRPPRPGPGPGPPPPGGPGGLGGLLSQLLPHGMDTDDLLILAVLLLSMRQDGAGPTELLMAVGLYFWL